MPNKDPTCGGVRAGVVVKSPTEALNVNFKHATSSRGTDKQTLENQKDRAMWSAIFGSGEHKQEYVSEISFTINGQSYKVGKDTAAETSLNTYIRDVAHLTGTKFMCNEGGCGACVVAATANNPVSEHQETFAVNSCLVPVFACDGWDITTVEGLGDRRTGYHRAQATLAQFNGTQCGYCSPGMVMNMYSLLEGNKQPTMAETENSFGGNICRCTGYRSILDAFKSLSSDATPELKQACVDIEDVYKICSKTGAQCNGHCAAKKEPQLPVRISTESVFWYKPRNITELFTVFHEIGDVPYKLVAGNTAEGVYRSSGIKAYIDIKDVAELRATSTSPVLSVGANVTLTEAMRIFHESATQPNYTYLQQLAQHIDKIANVPVRNIGTLAGNLSIKKTHPEFPSDIFTIFAAVGATLNIRNAQGHISNVSLTDYLKLDMNKKCIISILFPSLSANHRFRSFKITPRAQNAHAYVNAAFLLEFEDTTHWKVKGQPRIFYGGINPQFVRASGLEAMLLGKNLLAPATLTESMNQLDHEIVPDHHLPDAAPEFRKKLTQALFYKFTLQLDPNQVIPAHQSGGDDLVRPLSSGLQDFDTDESMWPVNKPIPKIEALAQCSGEAQFVNDIPVAPGELHGALVLTTIANGNIDKIDPSVALAMPGVIDFFSHTDLSEEDNNFAPTEYGSVQKEEVFCSRKVLYAGQVVGMIVAETRSQALAAVKHVSVTYANTATPMLTIEDVLNNTLTDRIEELKPDNAEDDTGEKSEVVPPAPAAHVIRGQFEIGKQYHLTMETQTCMVAPTEGGYEVYSATQWMDLVQHVVCRVLKVPASQVNVIVRRLGGGYGGKITRPPQFAAACAVAVKKLNRPVRLVMTMSDNMEVVGKRFGHRNKYEVGVDDTGKIEYLHSIIFEDSGCNYNDSPLNHAITFFANCYRTDNFISKGSRIRTDTPSNTWCRAPGTTEGIAFIEQIMEHIADSLNLDPLDVRMKNMTTDDNPLPEMIADLKTKSDYDNRHRAVQLFNNANRWTKRGMSIVPMQYRFPIWGNYEVLVAIHNIDGSVSVTHGGIEMGQGLNTKVAQVVAHTLGVSLDKITIHPSSSITAANSIVTGGSIGSEAVAYAAIMACQELLKRLEPVKEKLPTDATWQQLVKAAHQQNVELVTTYMWKNNDNVKNYNVWGATVAEVEVDILTGEIQVLRVDLIEDVGNSLSPMVDIGQIEGAFVMGMGYWLSEELVHDRATGRLLTTRTWNYKPPGPKDIPIDFRVYFRKNSPNPVGVLQSKGTGEPPLNMSIVVLFALRNAIASARRDAGATQEYHILSPPATTERIFMDCYTNLQQFTY